MIGRKKYPHLEVTAGKQLGKTFQLKKGEYSLGTHKKCNIKLSGEYASELHAVIKRNTEGVWTLTNNSPNGTYVNQLQVDTVELDRFSTIQVGVENSLDFTPLNHEPITDDGSGAKKSKKTNKWAWIVGCMLLVYLPAFAYLQQLGAGISVATETPVISLTSIENVTDASRLFLTSYTEETLTSNQNKKTGQTGMSLHEKVVMGAYSDNAEKDEIIGQLVEQSKSHLTLAHHYVQMNLDKKAIKALRRAMSVYPDHRYPASGYAAKVISALDKNPVKKGMVN